MPSTPRTLKGWIKKLIKGLDQKLTKDDRNQAEHRETEADISHKIIWPMLQVLGWPRNEVIFEYSIEGDPARNNRESGRVDIALLKRRRQPAIFVDVKRLGTPLGRYRRQLLKYCREVPAPIGVLTDSRDWHFYLRADSLKTEDTALAAAIAVGQDAPDEIEKKLKAFLDRDKVWSGDAKKALIEARKDSEETQIQKDLIKAWSWLFENDGRSLRPAFKKELLKVLKRPQTWLQQPYEKRYPEFVKEQSEKVLRQQIDLSPGNGTTKLRGRSTATTPTSRATATEQKPSRFYFLNKKFEFKSWAGTAQQICTELHRKNPSLLQRLVDLIPSRFALIANNTKSTNWTNRARPIEDSGILINLNLYAVSIKELCHKICEVLNLPKKDKFRSE